MKLIARFVLNTNFIAKLTRLRVRILSGCFLLLSYVRLNIVFTISWNMFSFLFSIWNVGVMLFILKGCDCGCWRLNFWKSSNFLLEVTSASNETSIGCFFGSNVMSPDALGFSSSFWIVSKANGFVDVSSCWFALDFFAENVWLVLSNFDNSGCVLLFVGKKREGFVLGGIGGGWSRTLTSLFLSWTACVDFSVRVGDDLLDSRRRELHFKLTLMSSHNRVDDWLNFPSSSRLLTSCSKICNFKRRFDCVSAIDENVLAWRFSRKTFSAAFLSSFFVSLMLFIRRVSVLKLFLYEIAVCRRSCWFLKFNSDILKMFSAIWQLWVFFFVILLFWSLSFFRVLF